MDTLALDLEEMETPRGRDWVRRKRREIGLEKDEPSTWFAYLETDHPDDADQALVTLGRSPADVLLTARLHATLRYGTWRGMGRWLLDANAREDGGNLYLIVRPAHDPDAPKTTEFAEDFAQAGA